VQSYGPIKEKALGDLDYRPYEQILIDPVLERQKRLICKYVEDEVYWTYGDRKIQSISIEFTDHRQATALVKIIESGYQISSKNGEIRYKYENEPYVAIYQLERIEGQWYIFCFQILDEGDPPMCEVKLPNPNPCND